MSFDSHSKSLPVRVKYTVVTLSDKGIPVKEERERVRKRHPNRETNKSINNVTSTIPMS